MKSVSQMDFSFGIRVWLISQSYPFVIFFIIFSAQGLLATVWISSDGEVSEKVYFLNGDSAKVVLYDSSRFNPQFIAAGQCIPNPIALVDQSDQTGGTARPTKTEIWEWNPEAKKFILRTTVPVAQKFAALANLPSEAKGK